VNGAPLEIETAEPEDAGADAELAGVAAELVAGAGADALVAAALVAAALVVAAGAGVELDAVLDVVFFDEQAATSVALTATSAAS
jgi:hypothetical protein